MLPGCSSSKTTRPPGTKQAAVSLSQARASSLVSAWDRVPKGKNARWTWLPARCTRNVITVLQHHASPRRCLVGETLHMRLVVHKMQKAS